MAWRYFMLAVVFCMGIAGVAQECPRSNATNPDIESQSRMLKGRLIFHDGLRKWFELKLDQPQCGQASIELVRTAGAYSPLEVLRGCQVSSKGPIGFSLTGYCSLDTYQDVKEIEPVGTCVRKAPFPDYSKVKPNPTVREYKVEMHIDHAWDRPISFRVYSSGRELHPWQAYASYWLTGGFVLYGRCAEGFAVDKVFGNPLASPSHFNDSGDPDDMASFDPEGAADAGKKDLDLDVGYTCVRKK